MLQSFQGISSLYSGYISRLHFWIILQQLYDYALLLHPVG